MFAHLFILLQVLGIIAFAMGVWFNFHQRQAKSPAVERVRAFFHEAQKRSGESEVMNAAIVVAAIISVAQTDYRIFAAMMGVSVVIGTFLIIADRAEKAKNNLKAKFAFAA
jgi:hypothetical protein